MTITQTVEIPADRRLIIDVPREIPAGQVILTFTPASVKEADSAKSMAPLPGGSARTALEAIQMAEAKAADPNRKPLSRHFGTLKGIWEEDAVAYQRDIRDEWE